LWIFSQDATEWKALLQAATDAFFKTGGKIIQNRMKNSKNVQIMGQRI
jgi:hypothetical protein